MLFSLKSSVCDGCTARWHPSGFTIGRTHIEQRYAAPSRIVVSSLGNSQASKVKGVACTKKLPSGSWKANIPVVGETLEYLNDPVEFMATSHLFGKHMFVVAPLEGWKQTVMTNEYKTVTMYFLDSLRALLDNPEILMQQPDVHAAMRRNMAPAFSTEAMAKYLPRVETRIRLFLEDWSSQPHLNLIEELELLTFGFAAEILVGLEVDTATERRLVATYRTFSDGLATFPYDIPGTTFWKAKRARDELLQIFERNADVIRSNVAIVDQKGRHNVLYYALLTSPAMDSRTLAVRALQYILAGHDTTRSSFGVMLLFLNQLPDVMSRLFEEQQEVVTRHGQGLTLDALAEMPYTEAVIREVLRLLGPARGIFRQALDDFVLFDKFIPAGSTLYVSSDGAHALDPAVRQGETLDHMDIYNLKMSFQPERWLVAKTKSNVTPTLTSFGAGPHLCLGMPLYFLEAKALLALLVRDYNVQIMSPSPGDIRWVKVAFPRPNVSVVAKVERRCQR